MLADKGYTGAGIGIQLAGQEPGVTVTAITA